MKKLTFLLLSIFLLTTAACSNSDSDSTENDVFDNLLALFNGNFITDFIDDEIEGIISISEDGNFNFEASNGEINGNVSFSNNIYSISNISGTGIFEGSSFTNGELDVDNSYLSITGIDANSSNIAINGPIVICPTNSIEDCNNNGNQGGLNIFENTLMIDYSISNPNQFTTTEQIDFTENGDFVFNNQNGARIDFGGPSDCSNPKSQLAFFYYTADPPPLTVGTFNVGVQNDNDIQVLLTIRDCTLSDYRGLVNSYGTITINRIDPYIPDTSGEIHVTFNNVRLGDLSGFYIVFSGTLKGRWLY